MNNKNQKANAVNATKKRTAVHLAQCLFVDPSFTHPVANANPNPDERIQPPWRGNRRERKVRDGDETDKSQTKTNRVSENNRTSTFHHW